MLGGGILCPIVARVGGRRLKEKNELRRYMLLKVFEPHNCKYFAL